MIQTIKLNLIPKGIPDVVNVSQFDVGREIEFELYEGANLYTIPSGVNVTIAGRKGDDHVFAYDAIIDSDRHKVIIQTTEQMTAWAGENLCQLRLTNASTGSEIATVNFRMIVQERPDANGDISDTDIPMIVELAREQEANAAASAAEAALSASAAATSETNAATSATNASNSATAAATSANNASTSETNAASSATSAGNSATSAGNSALTAEAWAVGKKNGTDVPSTDPQYGNNAKYWSDIAATYAAQLGSAVKWKASILFAAIPVSGMQNGDFYNIKDAFTTDTRFLEGAGMECPAGTDIVWAGDERKWNVMTPSGVNSFNGRKGTVTPASGDYSAAQITANVVIDGETKTNVADALEALADGGGGVADLSAIAPAFDDSTVYAVGKYVTYEGKLYRFTTRHTAGEWNPAHVTETSVDADFLAKTRDYIVAGRAANSTAGNYSTAEGSGNVASGTNSHVEGTGNSATNNTAHAEGQDNTAGGSASHAENYHNTITSGGLGGHAEGYNNNVSAYYGHAEGENNTVSHRGSHAEGQYNQTGATYQHVGGKYNVGKATTLFEIGNGTANNARANAFEVSDAGDVVAAGNITDGGGNVLSNMLPASQVGTIASHAFTAINHSVWFYPYVANTEYIPLTDWNPPAAGYMFLFVEQSWNNSMPTYIRVEKYIDSGSNGTKWQPIAVLSIEQANLGIHHLKLPIITPVAITDKFRFICKGAQNTSGNNQLILNGFVMS